MTTAELRAKFEMFCKENHWCVNRQRNGDYKSMLIENMWIGYRAAHASRDAEVEALRKDAERLNWLETQRAAYGFEDYHEGNQWVVDGPFNTARDAIDAAMRGESK